MADYEMLSGSMKEFMDRLGSKDSVPGGGGASAYVAALGMELGSMVANLTTGKKKYAEYEEEIQEILKSSAVLADELAAFIKKDAESFAPLAKAYGIPKEDPTREETLENALVEASRTPLELMEKVVEAMHVLERLAVIGSRLAISDVGVGIQCANAGLKGASLNVFINTKLMKNRETAAALNDKADAILAEGDRITAAVYESVLGAIRA